MFRMSYRSHLINFFKEQSQVVSLKEDELLRFPPVTLENFFYFELRRYPGFGGRPARLMLGILSTKEFAEHLNGSGELGPVRISGIELPPELEKQLIDDAEKCRAELLQKEAAEFPGIADLRILKNSLDRRVLSTAIPSDLGVDGLVRSPLLKRLNQEVEGTD